MLHEVLAYLNPQAGGVFIDATINGGGHARAIAERIGETGKLLGIDRDCAIVKTLQASGIGFQISDFTVVCDTFSNIRHNAEENGFRNVDGILFDLGFSSFHIEQAGRGFSFLRREPLDMRYDATNGKTAEDILRTISEFHLQAILREFGEERYAGRIARHIVDARRSRPIQTTDQLVEIIRMAVPGPYRRGRIHFATRTFQALRICVNDELEHVAKGLADAGSVLKAGGRLVVLSFHSGEDRIVKNLFRTGEKEGTMRRITKKPVRPQKEEARENPRARSVKLRVAEKSI
jgi:16S rRNA (cytosine1402-N4)-methyltransferase